MDYEITGEIFEEEMPNPNLYVTLPYSGGLWASDIFPWLEPDPWSFKATF
jgi:hypothetical protein